jgi:hypothetical protein
LPDEASAEHDILQQYSTISELRTSVACPCPSALPQKLLQSSDSSWFLTIANSASIKQKAFVVSVTKDE